MDPPTIEVSQRGPGVSDILVSKSRAPSQHNRPPSEKSRLTSAYNELVAKHIKASNSLEVADKRDLNEKLETNLNSCVQSKGYDCCCAQFWVALLWPAECPLIDPQKMDPDSKRRFLQGFRTASVVAGSDQSQDGPCPLLWLHKATWNRIKKPTKSRKRDRAQDPQVSAKRVKATETIVSNNSRQPESTLTLLGGVSRQTSPSTERKEAERQVRMAFLRGEPFVSLFITHRFALLDGMDKGPFLEYLRQAVHEADLAGPAYPTTQSIDKAITCLLWSCKGGQNSVQRSQVIARLETCPRRETEFALIEEALGVLDAFRSWPLSAQDPSDDPSADITQQWGGNAESQFGNWDRISGGGVEGTGGSNFDVIGYLLDSPAPTSSFSACAASNTFASPDEAGLCQSVDQERFEEPKRIWDESIYLFVWGISVIDLATRGLSLSEGRFGGFPKHFVEVGSHDGGFCFMLGADIARVLESLRHSRPPLADLLASLLAQKNGGLGVAQALMQQLEAAAAAETQRALLKQNQTNVLRELQAAHNLLSLHRSRVPGESRNGRHRPHIRGRQIESPEVSSGSTSGTEGVLRRKKSQRK